MDPPSPPRYPARPHSETSTTAIYTRSPQYPHANFEAHWSDKMSIQQQLQSKKLLASNSFDENNKQNQNFGKIYSTKQSLSVDSMPKRDTFWQNLTRSATNLLGRHLNSRGAMLKNWSSMNTPLSVTVVSTDFYKSLQGNKDHQMITPASKNFFATSAWFKEANVGQTKNNSSDDCCLFEAEIIGESLKKDAATDPGDTEKRWNEYKNMYVNRSDLKTKDQDIMDSVNNSQTKEQFLQQSHFDFVKLRKDLDNSANFGNTVKIDDEPVMLEIPESPLPQTQQQQQQQQPQLDTTKSCSNMVNTLLTTYNKVVNDAADLLQRRSASPDSALFTKRSCSPKLRPKKQHQVSSGRGRGRGKSQLRRSGVSQKRHRKERGRHAVEQDIKNDMDAWEELDYCDSTDDEQFKDVDECDFVKAVPPSSSDVSQKMCTPRKSEWVELESSSSEDEDSEDEDSEDEDSEDEVDECEEDAFRSRLSSCNSEDSYCIIFDEDATDESSEDDSSANESETEGEDGCCSKKVRFNLVPTVHRMIAWKFAYKAARRNQDLINKEHFRARIARTGRALDPVLKPQFRDRIYHERFEQ